MSTTTTKIVLITGATAGIGRTTALHLARLGHHVIATGRKPTALAAAQGVDADRRRARHARARRHRRRVDRRGRRRGRRAHRRPRHRRARQQRRLRRPRPDRARSATPTMRAPVRDQRVRPDGRDARVPARRCARAAPAASSTCRASAAASRCPFFGVYNSTKYAVESLSDALRYELRPFGIDVVLIEPGAIRTNFGDTAMKSVGSYQGSVYAPANRQGRGNPAGVREARRARRVGRQGNRPGGQPPPPRRPLRGAVLQRRAVRPGRDHAAAAVGLDGAPDGLPERPAARGPARRDAAGPADRGPARDHQARCFRPRSPTSARLR